MQHRTEALHPNCGKMFLGLKKNQNLVLEINGEAITTSKEVKLLGVTIDSKLNFKSHVKALCVKTNRKVSAFARVARYLDLQKAKLLYQSFVASTFKYCPLIWLFCGKTANENIDRVHKRALRVLLHDHRILLFRLRARLSHCPIVTMDYG